MNLQQIRDAVRNRVELDETDLPNGDLDNYIKEGYERIINLETRWPFFEQSWSLSVIADQTSFTLPTDLSEFVGIRTDDLRLKRIDHRDGEDYYGFVPLSGRTCHWSRIGRTIYLWPPPQTATNVVMRGYRYPTDWVAAGGASVVDADQRLHFPIVSYALSVVYAQQEDDVLEATNMNRFRELVAIAREAVMRPWKGETFTLGDGRLRRRYPFGWPHSYIDV